MTFPSAEMTKEYIDTLLNFQIFLITSAMFSYFVIFSASILGRLWVKGTAVSITSAVLFSLSMNTASGPRVEFRWGRDFPHPSTPAPAPGPPNQLYKYVPGHSRGVKRPEHCAV